MANEEYWVRTENDFLWSRVMDEFMKSEVKEYVSEYPFDFDDEDEEKLRKVYTENNEKYLNRKQLIKGLMEKGYTEKQAQELIEKYTTKEIEKETENWWDIYTAENLFRRPDYKLLKYYKIKEITKRIVKGNTDDSTTEIPDCYEIMQIEEWLLKEYEDLINMRIDGFYTFGTKNIPFKTIRKIFREAEKQGRKTLVHSEVKQKIIEECNTTQEETEIAIYGTMRTFKIREADEPSDKENQKQPKEAQYYWSGTSSGYPPLTLQDKILNPIKEIFREAEKQGKETLTHEELVQKSLEAYQKYKEESGEITYTKKVNREYVETMIEDAEELLLITAKKENSEIKYSLNHQILKNNTNQNKPE
jgi:hypothetical protein